MKKLFAILLVVVMLFSLTACKSKEQKAADKFVKDLEKLIDDVMVAVEDEDEEALEELMEEFEDMGEDYEDIYDDLKDKDRDAAKEFENTVEDMAEEMMEEMEDLYY